jgi:hypothetical protein
MKPAQHRDLSAHTEAATADGYLTVPTGSYQGRHFVGGVRRLDARHPDGVQPGDVGDE